MTTYSGELRLVARKFVEAIDNLWTCSTSEEPAALRAAKKAEDELHRMLGFRHKTRQLEATNDR